MWSRHKLVNELFVVLLRGNGMFGKNAFAGGRQSLAANITVLVAVCIGVCSRCIGTNVLTAKSATGGAVISKGVLDAVELCAAVLALLGAGVESYVAAGGILGAADGALLGASVIILVSKTGLFAANIADLAALRSRRNVRAGCGSCLTALVADRVAVTVIGVSHGIGDLEILAAVTANGAARRYGLVSRCHSVTGGAALCITGSIASAGVGVSRYGLAAALNLTDAVAVSGVVVEANVLADSGAYVAKEVAVLINVRDGLGGTALVCAGKRITVADPYVLLASVVAATVVTGLVASVAVSVLVVISYIITSATGAGASVLEIMHVCIDRSGSAAVLAGNGANELILVRSHAGSAAVGAGGGAGVEPSVLERICAADLAANVTAYVASLGIGVGNVRSRRAANGADGGALLLVGVLQLGAQCAANAALGSAIVLIGVSDRIQRGGTNGADLALAGLAGMRDLGLSDDGLSAAVAVRIAIRGVLMALGTETSGKSNKCQGNG